MPFSKQAALLVLGAVLFLALLVWFLRRPIEVNIPPIKIPPIQVITQSTPSGAQNPIYNAFLQSDLNGNGQGVTNVGSFIGTNFINAASGLPIGGTTTLPTYGYGANASGTPTMTFAGSNGVITAVGGYASSTNSWLGPTNSLNSLGTWLFAANSDCSITGIVMVSGVTVENSTRLWVFNKAATNITLRWSTLTKDGSRSLVITNGANGVYIGGFIPGLASNSSALTYY